MDNSAADALPADLTAMRALLLRVTAEREDWKRRHDQKELQRLRLEVELLRLKKWYYGPKADRLTHPQEVTLPLFEFAGWIESLPPPSAEAAHAVATENTPIELPADELPAARKVRRGRRDLSAFDKLPVVRREHDLPEAQRACPCCGEKRARIGEESSWQVEYVPGHFERIEHVRFKYACSRCERDGLPAQVELAPKPSQPIDKGLPGPGLLAFVVTSKFADYLPLYRLEDLFERSGFSIPRATQSVWCGDAADLLKPLFDRMVERVLQSHVICTDDTTMPMLSPGKGKTQTARMWVYVGDEANPYDVFHFTLSRDRDGPAAFLKDFRNTLLADGYGGYDGIVVGNDLTRAGCWAHARRKFVDAQKSHPAIADEAVDLIGRLYGVERQAKSMNAADRQRLRAQRSRPVLDHLHERLSLWKLQLLPKHPMSAAVGYALNQWRELNVFAADGAVPIDNNISEREMKRIVLGRKNSLFVGNQRGGTTAAVLASFTSTCRRHDIDPQRYLTQLLANLPDTPLSQLDQWLPDQWKAAHPDLTPLSKM